MLSTANPAASSALNDQGSSRPLIMVSNRGPVEHWFDQNGHIRRRNAGGGVATALRDVARSQKSVWVAGAASIADETIALLGQRVQIGAESRLRLVNLPAEAYRPFYECFCNPLLWFVQHSLQASFVERDVDRDAFDSWHIGYVPVNRAFAAAVIDEMDGEDGAVMLHDYHLYLTPRFIRDERPNAVLQHFVHIPWPEPAVWEALPRTIVRQILDGLLANDSVVFQSEDCVENFLATCRAYLGGQALVCERRGEIDYRGRRTSTWSNPISVDLEELAGLDESTEVDEHRQRILGLTGDKTIVRVDRLDPSKNVARGFEAFALLLERNPKLRGHVNFLAFLQPSRSNIAEYAGYRDEVFRLVEEINDRYGSDTWTPVRVFYEQDRAQALAALSIYDVLLVNSVADGMNLVSKEGVILNRKDGVLALSVTAGSFEELRQGALAIDPFDVPAMAEALETALAMTDIERRARAAAMREAVQRHQLHDWLRQQLKDIAILEYVGKIDSQASA